MTVGSKKLLSMAAAIGRGVAKKDSHLVTDAETSREWDILAAEHTKLVNDNPGKYIDLPHDPDLT